MTRRTLFRRAIAGLAALAAAPYLGKLAALAPEPEPEPALLYVAGDTGTFAHRIIRLDNGDRAVLADDGRMWLGTQTASGISYTKKRT